MSTTAIASLIPRRRANVAGEVRSVTSHQRPFPRIEAELDDGTGSVLLRFIGRVHVSGLAPGRRISAEGTPGREEDTLVMLNPLYSFEDAE